MNEVALPSLAGLTVGGAGVWTLVALFAIALVRVWPLIKARANELRKIEVDADGSLRTDLLKRISELEHQAAEHSALMAAEQARCDDKMAALRREMEGKYDGLMRQFIAAQMAWAQAIPPSQRSPAIDQMMSSLKNVTEGK